MNDSIDRLLNKKEIADHLRLSPSSIQKLVSKRLIPSIRISRTTLRFRLRDVEAALIKLTVKSVQTRGANFALPNPPTPGLPCSI